MISDEDVIELFRKCQKIRDRHRNRDRDIYSQFFRGKLDRNWDNHHPGGCKRDMTVFRRFNVIPEYCFNCYKVSIEPHTVMELFKLMMVFQNLDFPHDNTRKCMVENRPQVSGTYKGMVYCRDLEEGREIGNTVRMAVCRNISDTLPVVLKRGCTEYSLAYPDYAYSEDRVPTMGYRQEWRVYENIVDSEFVVDRKNLQEKSNNRPLYNLQDADTMFYWLKYAATMGDPTYLAIAGGVIAPFPGWNRPSPFNSAQNS